MNPVAVDAEASLMTTVMMGLQLYTQASQLFGIKEVCEPRQLLLQSQTVCSGSVGRNSAILMASVAKLRSCLYTRLFIVHGLRM